MSTAGGRITAGVGANLIGQHAQDRNQEATVYVGNLDPQANLVALCPSKKQCLRSVPACVLAFISNDRGSFNTACCR